MTWRDYEVCLSYPSGRTHRTSVRAASRRHASYVADHRWFKPVTWQPVGWERPR